MGYGLKEFGAVARGLAHYAGGIIVLFMVLGYGLAVLVIHSGASLTPQEKPLLFCVVVLYLIAVLVVFSRLVSKQGNKLFAPVGVRAGGHSGKRKNGMSKTH